MTPSDSSQDKRALTLPPMSGNVVLLTQLYWPTVHPALQEPRPRDRLAPVKRNWDARID